MKYDKSTLREIYDRTTGYCHICHKKLAFKNYGKTQGERGAWEVEHSNPRAKGGTDRFNNLYAACIFCNRSKGAKSTRKARLSNGKVRAPLSKKNRQKAKTSNAVGGVMIGAAIGSIFGPLGTFVGGCIGAHNGYKKNPDK